MAKISNWFKGLSLLGKSGVVVAVLLGSFVALGASSPASDSIPDSAPNESASLVQPPEAAAGDTAGQPKVEARTETVTELINFKTITFQDNALPKGQVVIKTNGREGERTLAYKVTYTDGKETARELISETISRPPVDKVIHFGTYVSAPSPKPKASCDPNYSGCVPVASDVDCAGGSGNGPAYARGPVRVIGYDIYDLDRDGDGVACE